MAKINNKLIYGLEDLPDLLDYLIGSKDKNGKTRNFSLQSIINLINGVNGQNVIQYKFFDGTTPDIDYTTPGAVFTNNNETDVNNFSSLIFNKKTLGNYDLTVLFDFLAEQESLFIGVDNPSNPNNFFTFKVISISNQDDYFIFNVEPYRSLYIGELSDGMIYSIYWETKEWMPLIEDLQTEVDTKLPHGGFPGTGQDLKDQIDAVTSDLSTNYYTKPEVDTKISSVYRYKGNVDTYALLPTSGRIRGDVWNALDTDINWAWTGTVWDALGGTVDVSGKEDKSNKQNSLIPDGTGLKYISVDAVIIGLTSKLNKGTYTGTASDLKTDIDNIYQPNVLISSVPPTRSVNTFTYPATQYSALINKTIRTNPAQLITTIGVAATDYKRTDLIWFRSDNVLVKEIGTESLTIAPRPDIPLGQVGVPVSYINVFGNVISDPVPITQEISIQNSLGVEQFKVAENGYMRFRGASFDIPNKQVVIDPLTPFTAFVDNVLGNNTTAEFGNVNKPYLTIDGVFNGLVDSVDRLVIVQLIKRGTYPINNKIPVGQITITSTLAVTLDLSANTNQYLFTYSDGALTRATFTFDIPFGKIQNTRASSGTGTSIAQAQTAFLINVKEIAWNCSSYIFYGLTSNVIVQKLDIINTVGKITQGSESFIPFIKISSVTISSNAVVSQFEGISSVEITSLTINSTLNHLDKNTVFKIGNIGGTGRLGFTYQTGVTSIEFVNSTISIPIELNQTVANVTFTGSIKSCSFYMTNQAAGGILNLRNLTIENISAGWIKCYGAFDLNLINTTIKTQGVLFEKSNAANNTANITVNNSTIEQVTPTFIANCAVGSIINFKVAGLETNANSLGNSSLVIIDYPLLSFKDKKNEIVVRSKVDLVNKILSSTTTYVIDANLVLLTGEYIQIPATGLTIAGYGFDVSSISKNVAGQSIFSSPAGNSGNFVTRDMQYNSGAGSVFNITDIDGSHAIEFNDVNFQSCASLGTITGFRQFTATTCGFYSLSDGLTLEGNWSGFKLTNSNVIGFGAAGTLFKKGTSVLFSNRFYIDLNIQIATGSKICDFADANFTNNKSLQVVNCYTKVNGVVDDTTTGSTFPNISPFSTKAYFVNNIGIKNSYNTPYGISTTNMLSYANDAAAAAGGVVAVGDTYIESSTGYFKKRLT